MLQSADPELSPASDGAQDSLRHEVEQILAQRLERSSLRKSRTSPDPAPVAPAPSSLRREKTQPDTPTDPAMEPTPDLASFEQDFAEELAREQFDPLPFTEAPHDEEPPVPHDRRRGDRRQAERRNIEFMRTELAWSTSPEDEDKPGLFAGSRLKPSRMVLLVVASMSAAIAAALFLTAPPKTTPAPPPELAAPVVATTLPVATTRVLVATEAVAAGQSLDETSLGWRDMADTDLLPGYVTAETDPDAEMARFANAVARYPLFPGDPIRADKLLSQVQQSLASTLEPGMRGVSVKVDAGAAAGGFIKPDDYVDVVLSTEIGGQRVTRTVLSNVRVLSINAKLGPATTGEAEDDAALGDVFTGLAMATLELDPRAAEVLVRAATSGELTLTLCPPVDVAEKALTAHNGANQSIRLTSTFWKDGYSPGLK